MLFYLLPIYYLKSNYLQAACPKVYRIIISTLLLSFISWEVPLAIVLLTFWSHLLLSWLSRLSCCPKCRLSVFVYFIQMKLKIFCFLSSSTCFGLNILSLLDRPKRGTVNSNLESSKFMLLLLFSAWKMAKNLRLARVCERMYCGMSNYIVWNSKMCQNWIKC